MLEFNKIINPKTNRKVNTNSKLGQNILNKYLFFSLKKEEEGGLELEELRKIAKRAEARKN
mgnify:CR=1 FL=1